MKRAAKTLEDFESDELTDLEDVLSPKPTFSEAISSFAYESSPNTRLRKKRVKIENIGEEKEPGPSTPLKKSASKRRLTSTASPSPSPRKVKPIQMELEVPHNAPPRWKETYELIEQMRAEITAPVDTMGCASAMKDELNPTTQRFGTLVSLMLSSQTKDEVTADAVDKLRAATGDLTIENILQTDDEVIQQAIGKVGFWRRKTVYLKQTAQKLKDEFNSDVPKTVDELCSLPGVGPKMAFLTLQVAWNINVGIGVDVHVHRITNRLRWHKPPTSTPEQTRMNLQSWLPKELHPEINPLLVGFGQVICLPVGPRCGSCVLSERGLCPSAAPSKDRARMKAKSLKRSVTDLIKEEAQELVKLEKADSSSVVLEDLDEHPKITSTNGET